jgi:hypothetical protein
MSLALWLSLLFSGVAAAGTDTPDDLLLAWQNDLPTELLERIAQGLPETTPEVKGCLALAGVPMSVVRQVAGPRAAEVTEARCDALRLARSEVQKAPPLLPPALEGARDPPPAREANCQAFNAAAQRNVSGVVVDIERWMNQRLAVGQDEFIVLDYSGAMVSGSPGAFRVVCAW